MGKLLNVFLPELVRGYTKQKSHGTTHEYAYVEHPVEKWRVYLRVAAFIHPEDNTNIRKFIVMKERGKRRYDTVWEPPKGRVEKNDKINQGSIVEVLSRGVLRETEEESRFQVFSKIIHTGLVFQSRENFYPENHYFQYHIFKLVTPKEEIERVFDLYTWYGDHPKAFNRLRQERRETDEISWFEAGKTKLNPWWVPNIVALYLHSSVGVK